MSFSGFDLRYVALDSRAQPSKNNGDCLSDLNPRLLGYTSQSTPPNAQQIKEKQEETVIDIEVLHEIYNLQFYSQIIYFIKLNNERSNFWQNFSWFDMSKQKIASNLSIQDLKKYLLYDYFLDENNQQKSQLKQLLLDETKKHFFWTSSKKAMSNGLEAIFKSIELPSDENYVTTNKLIDDYNLKYSQALDTIKAKQKFFDECFQNTEKEKTSIDIRNIKLRLISTKIAAVTEINDTITRKNGDLIKKLNCNQFLIEQVSDTLQKYFNKNCHNNTTENNYWLTKLSEKKPKLHNKINQLLSIDTQQNIEDFMIEYDKNLKKLINQSKNSFYFGTELTRVLRKFENPSHLFQSYAEAKKANLALYRKTIESHTSYFDQQSTLVQSIKLQLESVSKVVKHTPMETLKNNENKENKENKENSEKTSPSTLSVTSMFSKLSPKSLKKMISSGSSNERRVNQVEIHKK